MKKLIQRMLYRQGLVSAALLTVVAIPRPAAARAPGAEPSAYGRFVIDAHSCQVSFRFSSGKTAPLFKAPACGTESSDEGSVDSLETIGSVTLPARAGTDEYHLFTMNLPSQGNSGPPSLPFWAVVVRSDAAWASVQPFYEGEELSVGQLLTAPGGGLVVSEPATTTDAGVKFTILFGAASSVRLSTMPSKVISRTQRTLVGDFIGGFHASNWRPVVRSGNNDVVIDEDGTCVLPKTEAGQNAGPVRLLAEETKWDDGRSNLKCLAVHAGASGAAQAAAEAVVPGAPSAAECKYLPPKSNAPITTQLAATDQQANAANVEACKMRAAYTGLDKGTGAKPGASDKLLTAQKAWSAFLDAHDDERFPHLDEQGYYGSIVGMCIQAEHADAYKARTLELRAMQPCKVSTTSLSSAQASVAAAQLAMNSALSKMLTGYSKDHKFVAALLKAQLAFETLRRAHAAYAEAESGGNAVCGAHELERVTRARTAQLNVWLKPVAEGDTCGGSYGPP
jgi:uncharacterized protein YecT (DUF1311 family)